MSADLHLPSHTDPTVEAHNGAAVDPDRAEGAEPAAASTATPRRAWQAPQLTHIEIKRTLASSGAGSDSFASTHSA